MFISVKDAITSPKWRRISLKRLTEISTEIGMDVTQARQRDMMECFENVIIKADIFHALSQKLLNISFCRNCKG